MPSDAALRLALEQKRRRGLTAALIRARHERPFPQQLAFAMDRRRTVAAFAGVRGGKSDGGAQNYCDRAWLEACRRMEAAEWGLAPAWKPARSVPMVGEDEPAAQYWITGPTYTLAKVAWRKFLEIVAQAGLPVLHRVQGSLWWPDGSLHQVRTAADESQMQADAIDGAWVDELCKTPEESWDQIGNRVTDRMGWLIATGSPRPGTWPYYRIWQEGESDALGVHHWMTEDNPHIPREAIEAARRTMPRRWFDRDFRASWESAEGLVYDDFAWQPTPDGNLWAGDIPTGSSWWAAVDFGVRRPAVLLCATVPSGEDVVVDEAVLSDVSLPAVVHALADLAERRRVSLATVYCDPAGNARTPEHRQSQVQAMREGLAARGHRAVVHWPTGARTSISAGIQAVSARVRAGDGRRLLLVSSELDARRYPAPLVGICGSLRGYRYPDRPGAEDPSKDGIHDHFADALRYAVVCRHGVLGEQVSAALQVVGMGRPASARKPSMRW
jgi:hypothetical protein